MDRHSFRDIWFALGGARRREVGRWRHTLAIVQAVYNWGGPRSDKFKPKELFHMHERMFPQAYDKPSASMSLEEYRRRAREVEAAQRVRERKRKEIP